MARQLVESMKGAWKPSDYRDEFRARLSKVIAERMKHKGARVEKPAEEAHEEADKVVDLMAVLRRSLEARKGPKKAAHPARKAAKSSRQPQRKRA